MVWTRDDRYMFVGIDRPSLAQSWGRLLVLMLTSWISRMTSKHWTNNNNPTKTAWTLTGLFILDHFMRSKVWWNILFLQYPTDFHRNAYSKFTCQLSVEGTKKFHMKLKFSMTSCKTIDRPFSNKTDVEKMRVLFVKSSTINRFILFR